MALTTHWEGGSHRARCLDDSTVTLPGGGPERGRARNSQLAPVLALTTLGAASQPSKPRSLQCCVTHSTMLARPDSVRPARVWRQSAGEGLSGRSPQALTMLLQELATGEASGVGSGVMVMLAG